MSWRRHRTKNKKLKPGEDLYYQIEQGHSGDPENRIVLVKRFSSDHEAELFDNQLKLSRRPAISEVANPTFNQILPDFLTYYKLHRQPRSVAAWLEGWHHLSGHFGQLKSNQLSPALIDKYKTHRLSQKAGIRKNLICKRTVAKELANLSAIITFAVDRGLCMPLTFKIKGFSKKQTRPPQKIIPSPEQVQSMLGKCRSDVKPLYMLIYYAGLRSGEARSLTAKDVDLSRGIILVTGKGNKQRIIPIAGQLRPVIETAMEGKKPDDVLMISSRSGKPYSSNIGRLDGAARQAGITTHVSAHTLRHCFGTHAIYWGLDLRTVQLLMGHSESSTTEIYTTLAASFLTEQMKHFGTSPTNQRQQTQQP